MVKKQPHIAIIRLSAMGDVAMIVPVILAFAKQYPHVVITVVSKSFFKPIFKLIPNVNFVPVHTHHQHKGLFGIVKLAQTLKHKKVTHIADLHHVLRTKIIRLFFLFSNVKIAVTDKGRAEKKALTRAKNKVFKPLKPMTERHLETFAKLGFPLEFSQPYFLPNLELSDRTLEVSGIKTTTWIGIAPFAQHQGKIYPLDLMEQVLSNLSQQQNVTIFLFGGGKKECEVLKDFAQKYTNVKSVAGAISLEHELELISNLDVMLSMDSGNAHLAALFGVKTITLWGATHPFAGFAPYAQPLENCLVADRLVYPLLPTSVYGNKQVEGYEQVMRTILPEKVVETVLKQL